MIHDLNQAQATQTQLKALLTQPDVPKRALRRVEALLERLCAPVRIGVFGLPGSGKRAVVNALAGASVLPQQAKLPPIVLAHDETARTFLMQEDGTSAEMAGLPAADHFSHHVMFAEILAPLVALKKMNLLNVAAEPDDMASAIEWAGDRCDIALWCTRRWTDAEQDLWAAGPDKLKNHALLVACDGFGAIGPAMDDIPRYAAQIDPATDAVTQASADRLCRRIGAMIAEARSEDLDAAQLLIAQYAPAHLPAGQQADTKPASRPLSQVLAFVPAHRAPTTAPNPPDADAVASLSKVFWHLRHGVAAMSAALPEGDIAEDGASDVLSGCEALIGTLVDLAEDDPTLCETWPELGDTLRDANELVLLMRIEGGVSQASEAAILLAQVRQEFECALAA